MQTKCTRLRRNDNQLSFLNNFRSLLNMLVLHGPRGNTTETRRTMEVPEPPPIDYDSFNGRSNLEHLLSSFETDFLPSDFFEAITSLQWYLQLPTPTYSKTFTHLARLKLKVRNIQ